MSTISDIVAGSFVLAEVTVRSKAFTKKDVAATEQTIANNHASKDAGSFHKNLFATASAELGALRKAGAACRTYLYTHTTPYDTGHGSLQKGPRLLPATKSLDFMQGFGALEAAYKQRLADFESVYDARKATALQALGGMANPSDYPDAHELHDYFGVELSLSPVPASAQMPDSLPTEVLNEAANNLAQRQVDSINNAIADTRERLGEELSRMAGVLHRHGQGEKTKLYSSLLDNMRTVTDLLDATNVTNDPTLKDVILHVRTDLIPPTRVIDDYKISTELAATAGQRAGEIANVLRGAPSCAAPDAQEIEYLPIAGEDDEPQEQEEPADPRLAPDYKEEQLELPDVTFDENYF